MPGILDRFTRNLDPDYFEVARADGRWGVAAGLALVVIGVAGVVPATRRFFLLPPLPALLCFAPAFASGLAFRVAVWCNRDTKRVYAVCMLGSAAGMTFFSAALMALSSTAGALVFAAILILVAALYGHLLHCAIENPLGLAAVGVGVIAAARMISTPDHVAIFACVGPAALGASLMIGTLSLDHDRQRQRSVQLERAIQAQQLEAQSRDVTRLAGVITRVLENNHDASNALSAALVNARLLVDGTQAPVVADDELNRKEILSDLLDNLTLIQSLVEETRHVSLGNAPSADLELVALSPLLTKAAATMQRRTGVRIQVPPLPETLRVAAYGGEPTLWRILDNLLLNACEGDGIWHASRVEVSVIPESEGMVDLVISDDGPGFAAEDLAGNVSPWTTRKEGGAGLGLFIADRLLHASGGSLTRRNRATGGATVEIRLRTEATA